MAKIVIDESLCTGCGLCASSCPDCFEIKDDNLAHVISDKCGSCDVKETAEQCPVSAISVK
jgi:ferredoxin